MFHALKIPSNFQIRKIRQVATSDEENHKKKEISLHCSGLLFSLLSDITWIVLSVHSLCTICAVAVPLMHSKCTVSAQ